MKRPLNGLYLWVAVSLAIHAGAVRLLYQRERTVPDTKETYTVDLVYFTPQKAEEKKPEVKKKRKPAPQPEEITPPAEAAVEEEEPDSVPQEETGPAPEQEAEPVIESAPVPEEGEAEEEPPVEPEKTPDYTDVILGLRARIEREMVYPQAARRRGMEGVVYLLLKLDEDGSLIDAAVVRSSGYKVLDSAALSLIRRIVPYEHGRGRPISFQIPIRYSLVG